MHRVARNPSLNTHWDEAAQEIVQFGYVNLGIAAATARGLVVPNIKDAERMRCRTRRRPRRPHGDGPRRAHEPGRLSGGTISITNIGVFGIDAGTPILNPGEAAILAMGAVRRQPWEYQDGIALRQVMTLSLSFDHRLVDGEQGSRFLADIGAILRPGRRSPWCEPTTGGRMGAWTDAATSRHDTAAELDGTAFTHEDDSLQRRSPPPTSQRRAPARRRRRGGRRTRSPSRRARGLRLARVRATSHDVGGVTPRDVSWRSASERSPTSSARWPSKTTSWHRRSPQKRRSVQPEPSLDLGAAGVREADIDGDLPVAEFLEHGDRAGVAERHPGRTGRSRSESRKSLIARVAMPRPQRAGPIQ